MNQLQVFCKESELINSSALVSIDVSGIESAGWLREYKRVNMECFGGEPLLNYEMPAGLTTDEEFDFYNFVMLVYALLELPVVIFVMHDTPTIPQFYYNTSASMEENRRLALVHGTPVFDHDISLFIPFMTAYQTVTIDDDIRMQYAYLMAAMLKYDGAEFKIKGASHHSKTVLIDNTFVQIKYQDALYDPRYFCIKVYFEGDYGALVKFISEVNINPFMMVGKFDDMQIIISKLLAKYTGSELQTGRTGGRGRNSGHAHSGAHNKHGGVHAGAHASAHSSGKRDGGRAGSFTQVKRGGKK